MKKITLIIRIIPLVLILLVSSGISINKVMFLSKEESSFQSSSNSLTSMLEQVVPSVVSIDVEGSTIVHSFHSPHYSQSFFDSNSFFCNHDFVFQNLPLCHKIPKRKLHQEFFHALGSGVIINSKQGYVVTNNHVVNHADRIKVQLSNGNQFNATVIGKDPRFDIALLKLKNVKDLHEIKIANSDFLKVGDSVIAIGNPYGLGETVTSGIISALNRSGLNIERYENFIQTDAAINKGNSGGALVNLKGELIGINTAILAPDGGNIGIGFAIPINTVKNLTSQMLKNGYIRRAELGITGMELNSDLAKVLKINVQRGALVSQVLPRSSADLAGLKVGDVITSLNNKPVVSFYSLRAEIASLPDNTKMRLGLLRDGNTKFVMVVLQSKIQEKMHSATLYSAFEGADLSNFYLNGKKSGVHVDYVENNTTAYRIGFKKDDLIIEINKNTISSLEDIKNITNTKPSVLVFYVKRGINLLYLIL